MRGRKKHCGPSALMLVGWEKVELFDARRKDRPILYVVVESFEWSSYSCHRLLGVPTPLVMVYCSNLVLRPHGAQRHFNCVIAFTELAVCTIMCFLLPTKDGFCRLIVILPVCNMDMRLSYRFQLEYKRSLINYVFPRSYEIFNLALRRLLWIGKLWSPSIGTN